MVENKNGKPPPLIIIVRPCVPSYVLTVQEKIFFLLYPADSIYRSSVIPYVSRG
jgi:hypothetical protein